MRINIHILVYIERDQGVREDLTLWTLEETKQIKCFIMYQFGKEGNILNALF